MQRNGGKGGLRGLPKNGNSRKVLAGLLAGVLAQVLAKTGVLARVLAQVLAGCFVSVFPNGPTCQHLCQHSGHPHFCQQPRQHFSGIPILGFCTRSPGSQDFSALGKWGRTQMGSDGFNRILSGFYLLGAARVRPVPSETHDFKGFRPDFNRILTGL